MDIMLYKDNRPLAYVTEYEGDDTSTLEQLVLGINGFIPSVEIANALIAIGGIPTRWSADFIRKVCGDRTWQNIIRRTKIATFIFEIDPETLYMILERHDNINKLQKDRKLSAASLTNLISMENMEHGGIDHVYALVNDIDVIGMLNQGFNEHQVKVRIDAHRQGIEWPKSYANPKYSAELMTALIKRSHGCHIRPVTSNRTALIFDVKGSFSLACVFDRTTMAANDGCIKRLVNFMDSLDIDNMPCPLVEIASELTSIGGVVSYSSIIYSATSLDKNCIVKPMSRDTKVEDIFEITYDADELAFHMMYSNVVMIEQFDDTSYLIKQPE